MRRALPWFVVLVGVGMIAVLLRPAWFGLSGDAPAAGGPAAEEGAAPLEAGEGLAGRGGGAVGAADPKTYEGESVGAVNAGLGSATLVGRVTGDGQPVRFARVSLVLPPPAVVVVRTRKDGGFEVSGLPAGEFDVRVAAEGWWPRTVRAPALSAGATADCGEIPLKARPPMTDGIEVKVLGPDGRPVNGARAAATTLAYGLYVTMGPKMAGITDVVAKEATTDETGVARLSPLPAEKYDVVVRAPGFVLEAVENVVVASGRVEHVVVTLQAGLSVSGTVVDVAGQPVAGAYVTALGVPSFRSFEAVLSDGQGAFRLEGLLAGTYWMFAGHDEKGEGQATDVKAGSTGVRIELKGTGRLTGKVVLADGKPAARFVLRPYPAQPFRYVYSRLYEFADPEGKFSLPLAPGTYQVDARADGAAFTSVPSLTVLAGETKDVVITLPAEGVVRGVVTDPDGNQLSGAEVYVKRGGFPPTPVREQYARADADGRFELRGLPLEKTNLHVRHAAYALKVVDAMPAPSASATEITVRLSRGAKVVGRVTTQGGSPVAGLRMNLSQGFAFFDAKTAFTDADGRYEFLAVAKGEYAVSTGRFEANAAGQRKGVSVPEDGVATCDFVTEGEGDATGAVQGRVTIGGAPAADATVMAVDERGFNAAVSGKTDADGRYLLKGLKPGRITVSATSTGGVQSTEAVRIREPGQTVALDIVFGTASFRGVVVGSDGRTTVSGAWVQVETAEPSAGGQAWEAVRAVVQTDAKGVVAAAGLEPGTYRLRIQGTGYALRLTDAFRLGDGEARDLGSVRLVPGGGLSGRVTDESGAPLENVGVSLHDAKGEDVFLFSLASTGSNGRYEVQGVELGAYTVTFEAKGYAPVTKPATVTASGAVVDAVLYRGGAVAVRVEDERGQPIEGARVVLVDASGQEVRRTLTIVNLFDDASSRTGADGAARIKDLAPGAYRVSARKDGLIAAGEAVPFAVSGGGEARAIVVMKAP